MQSPGIPLCLFYADDGVILTDTQMDLAMLLYTIEEWTVPNAILLNPAKYAIVTSLPDLLQLYVYGQGIPQVDSYIYLGFPVTLSRIDFQ